MPNCDFYSLGDDSLDVLHFVFAQSGWHLYELSSLPDSDLRSFDSVEAVRSAFDLAAVTAYFHLYSPTMGGAVHCRRIDLDPGAIPNASFRYASQGWGLIQLYFEAPRKGSLRASHTNHNSHARARIWEPTYADEAGRVDEWNWVEVERISRRLNRHIRSLAAAKLGGRAILPCAQDAVRRDVLKLAT